MVRFQKSAAPNQAAPGAEPVDPLSALGQAAIGGDRAAERTLLIALGPTLLRAVRGVLGPQYPDVEDVLQEAMTGFLAALSGFRGDCQIAHFGCRIAVQTAMNARRRASYRTRYTPSTAPDAIADLLLDERSPAEACAAAARTVALRALLDELPPAQSEALVLHVVLGYSVEETARATRAPVNTVRSRLRAALAALRNRVHADQTLLESLDLLP